MMKKKEVVNLYDDIFIYVPSMRQIVKIAEGSGDSLDDSDYAAGYVDYIYYEQYAVKDGFPDIDGGIVLLTELFQDKFKSTKESIPNVLDMAYGNNELDYIVL